MRRIDEEAVLALQPWVRLQHDRRRDRWVLLAPERVLFPCPVAMAVLTRLGPDRRFGTILDLLADEYEAPREAIRADVEAMLAELIARAYLRTSAKEAAHD
ncbi:pyrroloquinoline quinone biosynthesis peptide chaperone PqqD [Marinimicrococcus flavescens]|uniref:Pyrroloquinoline quinone biosynthesis peptide chaperone PqqD n=1 Tax=Marinimicrococcus flavescens TaxID=3031815 RepID=A0AAP3UZ44_9PROT|nr:pyrroloquinoline quinone biosynthesis peptide chaperone PqqD [Marinimicrococcus flavescens]